MNNEKLKITFLGGIGEIGKNMTAFEYGKDMIVVDAGQSFPDEDMPGVDQVVQDLTYLEKHKSKMRGLFITHGHEDHIGAIPYFLDRVKTPIYGSRVSLGLIENKLKESKKTGVIMKPVKPGTVVVAGNFKVEFVSVTHSIPGAFALVITTPAGVVVHTGDFKIDFTPVGNDVCDLKRLAEVGKKGVTLLMSDSTNVEREGFSMSESVVGKTFDELFGKLKTQRIIIATFASNIHRLQQIIDCAKKYGRKIAFTGRSMVNVSDMAIKLGELKCDKDIIVDIDKVDTFEDKELIIISTGSQGEAMSALTRIASDNFPKVKLGDNDVVILSSSAIPGNEKAINNLINVLYRKGCKVIYNELADVHASGHAYKEELKILHSLIKPKFFIPVHGEYRHLKNHQMLAKELGMKERNIIIPELGMQVELTPDTIKVSGMVQAGSVLIDGTGLGEKDSNVIRDRLLLSQDGVCVVVATLSSKSGRLVREPDIISRGFVYQDEASDIIKEAKDFIYDKLSDLDLKAMDKAEIRASIRKVSTSFFFKHTKRKPVILSVIVEAE
jgi:ribonuclease J